MKRASILVAAGASACLGFCPCLAPTPARADSSHHKHPKNAAPVSAAPAAQSGTPSEPAALPAPPPSAPEPTEPKPEHTELPAGHQPVLAMKVEPRGEVKTGQIVAAEISAVAAVGDDVTIADQSFEPFEVHKKQLRVEPAQNGKQRFVFNLELLALEPGDKPIPAIQLRIVTKDNFIGVAQTAPVPYKVQSLVANEPNAQPKLETKPVAVLEDNYIPIYVLGGLLAAAAVVLLTLLAARYMRRRKARALPPPPPRPPWEIAVEQLGRLRAQKERMLEDGQGGVFVDQLSDVVRAYLGGRYAFDGLEQTSDEMLMQLKTHGVSLGFTQEVGQFLARCDLVKFAKVEPDTDEVDLLFAKAQDLVHLSEPPPAPSDIARPGAGAPPNPSRSERPSLSRSERPNERGSRP
jgi:hypothetical protein